MEDEYGVVEETEEEEMDYEETDEPEDEEDDSLDFSKLFGDNEADSEEGQPEDEEEPVQTDQTEEELEADPGVEYDESTGEWIDKQSGEKLLPQSKVNEIVGSARIKGREYEDNVKYLEYMTGMPFDQIAKYIRENQIEKAVEEHNFSPEQAERFVEEGPKSRMLEKEMMEIRYQQQQQQAYMQREQEKHQYIHNPLVKKYEAEIDQIVEAAAQGGQPVSWAVAMNHVIGQKALKGDLSQTMENNARRKINKSRKPKMSPETGGGSVPADDVPKELAFFAKVLGEDPTESFSEYKKIQKEKELRIP